MPRSIDNILAHSEELATRFENYEPRPEDERDPAAILCVRDAVIARAQAEKTVSRAVASARTSGLSWATIGSLLGTTGEAARQRYGKPQPAA